MVVGGDMSNDVYRIVNVGRAAGKLKFCLMDKDYGWIVDNFHLRAALIRETSSSQPSVHVLAFPRLTQPDVCGLDLETVTVQQLVWQAKHPGSLMSSHSLQHLNGNTMDNRADNIVCSKSWEEKTTPILPSQSTYSLCVGQLSALMLNHPEHHIFSISQPDDPLPLIAYHSKHELLGSANGMPAYMECHSLTCTNIERRQFQFNSCVCRCVRYCSSQCQLDDWPSHQHDCDLIRISQSQPSPTNSHPITYSDTDDVEVDR